MFFEFGELGFVVFLPLLFLPAVVAQLGAVVSLLLKEFLKVRPPDFGRRLDHQQSLS